jgi:acetyl-CoA C-acetyltransferase
LMQAALRLADADAGAGWLPRLDSLGVVAQISFPGLGDLSTLLAGRLEIKPLLAYQTRMASGDSPILLLNEAANRIAAGEVEVAAVVGARPCARRPNAPPRPAATAPRRTTPCARWASIAPLPIASAMG